MQQYSHKGIETRRKKVLIPYVLLCERTLKSDQRKSPRHCLPRHRLIKQSKTQISSLEREMWH